MPDADAIAGEAQHVNINNINSPPCIRIDRHGCASDMWLSLYRSFVRGLRHDTREVGLVAEEQGGGGDWGGGEGGA